ncbi:MAG TPA: extracellular solute-binding protein [Alphaproteobacteria bacterium]|nr:extracellular solute-binding protein [Alphaproteobacteria bacterium]
MGVTRRRVIKTAALATASVVAAPFVRGAYAAGKLSLGCWDHWVPGANATFTKLCNEWGAKNHVEIQIDYITSQGEKDKLTAAAEAQAGAGHDIMTHRDWNITVHRRVLEPISDVVDGLVKQYGPISPVAEYLAKHGGTWYGVPTTCGSQVKPCCSRIDLYKKYCDLDVTKIFPGPGQPRDQKLIDTWTWDLYLSTAEKLFKGGYPVGLPMGQTSDAIDWTGALFKSFGSVMIDEKDQIKVDSPETRQALEFMTKLMAVNPPEVYAWDDAGNNRWLISGKGSGIMNPPSAWTVAVRDNPKVGEQCWTHAMPRGPKGRFVGQLPIFYGIWNFSKNKSAAKDLLTFVSQKDSSRQLVAASNGYDLPSFKSFYDFDTWKEVKPPPGTVYNYPPRDDEETSMAGWPARPDVGAQIYNQALQTVMVSKVTQGKQKIDDVIKWASNELEGYLRT